MNVLVLGGGDSTERDVSIRSAKAVTEALKEAGFSVTEADPNGGDAMYENLPSGTIVFPILHGTGGEDGKIQQVLEAHKLPYLGTTSQPSAVCFSKWRSREALQAAGLPVARGAFVTKETYPGHELTKKPHVLKVDKGGSSIGTLIVRDPTAITDQAVTTVFALGSEAVLEELVEGVEITVPILDTDALPVIEIRPPTDKEFDYENKYNGATQELCPPVSVDRQIQASAQALAKEVHQALGCRHLSRTDIIVRPDNSLVVLEINTMPGLTDQSLYPKSARVAGITMPELMKKFVALVQRDYGIKE